MWFINWNYKTLLEEMKENLEKMNNVIFFKCLQISGEVLKMENKHYHQAWELF